MSAYPNPDVLAEKDWRRALNPDRKGAFLNGCAHPEVLNGYAHPEVLVETDWVKANIGKPGIKLVEVDVDIQAYDAGHIPGAVGFNWQTELQDQLRRDIIGQGGLREAPWRRRHLAEDTVILYGDNNNWFAAYGFWLFKIYGHKDVRLMNGGRVKWLNEQDKALTTDVPNRVTPIALRGDGAPPRACGPGCPRCMKAGSAAPRTWWTCAAPTSTPGKSSRRRG